MLGCSRCSGRAENTPPSIVALTELLPSYEGLIISKQMEKKITNGMKVIGGELQQGDVVKCGKAAAYLEWSDVNTQRG